MRIRQLALAASASALAAAALPAVASAHRRVGPSHIHGLTIVASPSRIVAGAPVLIYGQLKGTNVGAEQINLYHRIAGRSYFTLIQTTTTNGSGYYEFTRAPGIVNSNRNWYVTAPGLSGNIHSNTVHEYVSSALTLSASVTATATRTPVLFNGTVSVGHVGEKIYLQAWGDSAGTGWRTIAKTRVAAGSVFALSERFVSPGYKELRVLLPSDARNTAGVSDPVELTVQQAQVSGFTLSANPQKVAYGTGTTLSGVLDEFGSSTPAAGVKLALYSHTAGQGFTASGLTTTTASDGSYSFTLTPLANTDYQVRVVAVPTAMPVVPMQSAVLLAAVTDLVTLTPSATTAQVGGSVTFTGSVTPAKAGDVAYLEQLGNDGHWHIAQIGFLTSNSTYSFDWTFGVAGSHTFRVRIPGDTAEVGSESPSATISVTTPAVSSLPTSTSAS